MRVLSAPVLFAACVAFACGPDPLDSGTQSSGTGGSTGSTTADTSSSTATTTGTGETGETGETGSSTSGSSGSSDSDSEGALCDVIHEGDLNVVDAELDYLARVVEVTGTLKIEHSELLEAPAMPCLREAESLSIVVNPQLGSIAGLASLERVHTIVGVGSNDSLTSLVGLEGLQTVGDLSISGPSLVDISAISGVKIAYSLSLRRLDQLTDLDDLAGLTGPLMYLNINNNGQLTNIAALGPAIDGHAESVTIRGNPQLASLGGLEGLTSAVAIELDDNPALVDLSGLEALTDVDVVLVTRMEGLSSLSGLEGLEQASSVILGGCGDGVLLALPALADASALNSLTALDSLGIGATGLATLPSLSGVAQLNELVIENNEALGQAEIDAFLAAHEVVGEPVVCGNSGAPLCVCSPVP